MKSKMGRPLVDSIAVNVRIERTLLSRLNTEIIDRVTEIIASADYRVETTRDVAETVLAEVAQYISSGRK